MNTESVIFGFWLNAVSLVTNHISEGIPALTFSVRRFVCHYISYFRIILFLQILRQSFGIWKKGGCFRLLKFSRTDSLSTDKCVTWMKMVSEVRTKASRCDVRKIICYMSTWSSTRRIRSALTNRSRNIALAWDKHACETNDRQHALHHLKFSLKRYGREWIQIEILGFLRPKVLRMWSSGCDAIYADIQLAFIFSVSLPGVRIPSGCREL